jgi:hypothetical protein
MRRPALAALAAVLSLALASSPALAAGKAKTKKAKAKPVAEKPVETQPSAAAERVLSWIGKTQDNGDYPYIVIDKTAARLFLFDPEGKRLGEAPVLIGIAKGDDSSPGVGAKALSELGPAEKTTPAGRYLAKFGYAAGGKKVLWIDYADSVALHAVVTGNKKEHRVARLNSPEIDDNRITFGCVNVPTAFYSKTVSPLFKKDGGVVYVLPDTKALEDVFPALHADQYFTARAED